MSDKVMVKIVGGATTINGTFLNSLAKVFSTVLEIGRAIGSSINRAKNKNFC